MRDISTKVNGSTTLDAGDFNALNDELENMVESADLTLDPAGGPDTDLFMLSKAIAAYANAGNVYQDSGAANAYVLSLTTNLLEVDAYYDNMAVKFKAGNTSTGASTVNVNGIGVKNITTPDGVALVSGAIIGDEYYTLVYNLSSDRFELLIPSETILQLPVGVDGLALSNNTTDSVNDLDIAIGGAADSTRTIWLDLTSSLTKQFDATWAAGTNQGGLDTGSFAVDTWYYIWLISKAGGADVDILLSASATAPTMPATYTLKRRIGAVYAYDNAATPTLRQFRQAGDSFHWKAPVLDASGITLSTVVGTQLMSVPPIANIVANFRIDISMVTQQTTSSYHGVFGTSGDTLGIPSATNYNAFAFNNGLASGFIGLGLINFSIPTTTGQIDYDWSANTAGVTFSMITDGWIDERQD
jgi:hypothetical protein